MLQSLHVHGYRSLRDFRLKLGRVTVVTGENGVGKSNLYRSLALLQRMAEGRFAAAVAEEGGMPSLLWAGERRNDEARRVGWRLEHDDFSFEAECGMLPASNYSRFKTDPEVKKEQLRFGGQQGKVMARRKGPMIELRGADGKMEMQPLPFHAPESMLSEIRDGIRYPAVMAVREVLTNWRFYHQFRSDADSAMRRPQTGFRSPVLAHDGSNLAATLQTILENQGEAAKMLMEATAEAFPDTEWDTMQGGSFALTLERPRLLRPLKADELSDGTLRFFCLCAALLSLKPPPMLVLNEPENSLHPGLLAPLAGLIAQAGRETQVLVVTHSTTLAEEIGERCEAKLVPLISAEGETRMKGEEGGRRVWTFE